MSEWAKLSETYTNLKHSKKIIENEYIGLGIYEVNDDLNEILFVGGEGSMQSSQSLAMDNRALGLWDEYMDISLSLLVSSVGINDTRVAFLLRMMAVEALVSKNQMREEKYVSAIELLSEKIDQMEISAEYKDRLTLFCERLPLIYERFLGGKIVQNKKRAAFSMGIGCSLNF